MMLRYLVLMTHLVLLVKEEQQVLVESATQERAKQISTVDTTIWDGDDSHVGHDGHDDHNLGGDGHDGFNVCVNILLKS